LYGGQALSSILLNGLFLGTIRSKLGVLALARKTIELGESDQLRESSIPYVAHFGVKKSDIGSKNTYF
jgi:hypothetical protein